MKSLLIVSFCVATTLLFATLLPASAGYLETKVTNGGMVRGAVRWKGNLPPVEKIPVTKDQTSCGNFKSSPCLKIGKNQGVANTVVYLEKVTSGKSWPQQMVNPVLDQKACEYEPHILLFRDGAQILILNSDPLLHNVHVYQEDLTQISGKKTLFNIAFPVKGQKVNKTIPATGVHLSLCDAGHPWMSSHMFAVAHPYYTLTDADGAFLIDQVPAGSYTLRIWHEGIPDPKDKLNAAFLKTKAFERSKTVTVTAGGTVTIDFELN